MGAMSFETTASGRTVHEAFITAQNEARYYHGHGGYTGTIAEKPGVFEVTLPPRISSARLLDVAWRALEEHEVNQYNLHDKQPQRPQPHVDQLYKWLTKPVATTLLHEMRDKWGMAIGVRMLRSEDNEIVPRTPTGKRRAKHHGWLFFGMASC